MKYVEDDLLKVAAMSNLADDLDRWELASGMNDKLKACSLRPKEWQLIVDALRAAGE